MHLLRARFFLVALLYLVACGVPQFSFADTAAQKANLEAQLAQVRLEIQQNQLQLATQQAQRASLERDVAILASKVQAAQLQIQQRNLTIQELQDGIVQKRQGISGLDAQVSDSQASLAEILRQTNQADNTSFVEIALGGSLSDVFQQADDFEQIQSALGNSFTQIAAQKSDLTARERALLEQQQEAQDLLQLQVVQQSSMKQTEKEKQNLVTAAKGQESNYKKVIAAKQQTAAQIEAALFGLRDTTKSVSFGDMYAYAKEASAKTGVRPAVILGILAEESNLGQNVGTGNWKVDMNPTRDAPVFAQICSTLGINPDTQPVSKKPWYGWGGAMGPAQFIPSTWVQYQDRISNMTGQSPANPWDPRTATFATAILMMDNGADTQTRDAERLAALRYLAGWKNASKAAYSFYGDDVMELADKFQSQINVLGG